MRVALDTNVLAYAEAVNGIERQAAATAILDHRLVDHVLIPAQVMAELFNVLVRKGGHSPGEASRRVRRWSAIYETVPLDSAVLAAAMQLVEAHRIGFWDAIVLASAAEAGCELLLSEDFQDGFAWRGVTVRNPFESR